MPATEDPPACRHARSPHAACRRSSGPDDGLALVLVLTITSVLAAAGLAVLLMVDADVVAAGRHRDAARVLHAAEAALDTAVDELGQISDWGPVLSGAVRSRVQGTLRLPAVDTGVIDAGRETWDVQRAAFGGGWGVDTPQWRLFAHGDASGDVPLGAPDIYLLVWVADDVGESDGSAARDTNDVIVVRARAVGVRRAVCDVQAVIARTPHTGVVRKVSSRVVR